MQKLTTSENYFFGSLQNNLCPHYSLYKNLKFQGFRSLCMHFGTLLEFTILVVAFEHEATPRNHDIYYVLHGNFRKF